jgi:beta-lactamase regulating signal transducer with metallopeptidase domain
VIHSTFLRLAPGLVSHIVVPAIRTGILAILVGLALAFFRPRNVHVRLAVWTLVLYAGLAMPFLSWFLPSVRLPLPVPYRQKTPAVLTTVPANAAAPADSIAIITSSPGAIPAASRASALLDVKTAISSPNALAAQQSAPFPARKPFLPADFWALLFVGGYFLAVAILLGRFTAGQFLSRRLRNTAAPLNDSGFMDRYSQALGITPVPLLAESKAIAVPATLGVKTPLILLPWGWRSWDNAKLGAVLAHELSHVKRRDAFTVLLSAIHQCIFCFSPLAWWLDRELKDLAEEASDEAALRAGADATDYAEVLLSFFTTLATAGRRVRWQAISIAQGSRAERRLDRILHAGPSASCKKSRLLLMVGCALPAVCLIAAARPSILRARAVPAAPARILQQAVPSPAPAPQTTQPAPAANPASPPMPPAPAAPNPKFRSTVFPKGITTPPPSPTPAPNLPASPPRPATLAALPKPPRPPEPAEAVQISSSSQTGNDSRSFYRNGGPDYAVVSGKSLFTSGSEGERDEVESLRAQVKGNFIWFRRNGKSYVIEDPATVKDAAELFEPEEELGKEQAALGKEQEALGKQQAAWGKQMTTVRVQVPSDLLTQMEHVEMAIKQLGPNASQQQLARLQGELGRLQGELGRLQSKAGGQNGTMGKRMGELGRRQGELGRQQGRLGREQARLARHANRQMGRLIDDAFAHGLAKPVSAIQ